MKLSHQLLESICELAALDLCYHGERKALAITHMRCAALIEMLGCKEQSSNTDKLVTQAIKGWNELLGSQTIDYDLFKVIVAKALKKETTMSEP